MGQLSSWLWRCVLYAATLAIPFLTTYLFLRLGDWLLGGGQTDTDLTKHRYVLGLPGCGKSMYLVAMLRESVRREHAAVWVSTHGARQVMRYLPADCLPYVRVEYFHPLRGLGINLFRRYTNTPLEKAVLASQAVTVFRRLFGDAMGQGMVELAHAGALALLEEKREVTLLDLYRALRSGDVDTANEVVGWTLANADKRTHAATVRRLGGTLASDVLLRCLSATGSNALDLGALIDPAPIVIVCDIDKGEIGNEAADLLAHIVTSQLELVLSARSGHERMVDVYLDECQTYAHDGLAEAIEEGRKRKVCWTFAHQSREQMPERLKAALELCGSQYFFTLRPQDARYAASVLNRRDIKPERFVSLPPRIYRARVLEHGRYRVVIRRTPTMRPGREFRLPPISEPVNEAKTPTTGILVRHGAGGAK